MFDLKKAVQDKISELGVKEASKFFGVSLGTISNWANGKTSPSADAAQLVLKESPPTDAAVLDSMNTMLSAGLGELTMWEGKQLIILSPVYRAYHPDTHYTLFANYAKYGPDKIGMIMEKGTQIHVARNLLVHKARKIESMKYVMFPDDDMIFPCGNADVIRSRYGADIPEPGISMNAISRMMSHPESMRIIGALYFGRNRFGNAQVSLGFDQGWEQEASNLRKHKYTAPMPVRWIGTGGMLRIHKSVFDDLQKAIDGGMFPECKPENPTRPYGFFTPIRAGMGEDVSFGIRCGEIGIQTFLDPVLECLHIGELAYGSHNTQNQPNVG